MTDLVVIGGGPGGIAAAIRARQLGSKVTLVEERDLGGLCMNRGCIPTKTLLHTIRLYERIMRAEDFGIRVEGARLDLEKLAIKRRDLVEYLRKGTEFLLSTREIEVIRGKAHFLNQRRIVVNSQVIEARAFIIATGSSWNPPAIPGIDQEGVISSEEAMEMTHPPESIVVLGGGPLELEFAMYFHTIGSRVTIVEEASQILPFEDRDIANRMTAFLMGKGIRIIKGAKVQDIRRERNRLFLNFSSPKDGIGSVDAEFVLTMRRVPNIGGLEIERAGIRCDEGRILVDEEFRTNIPGIYAVGDVTGGPMFSHRASAQGISAAENIHGLHRKVDPLLIPRAFYGIPEIGAVGLTEREAKAKGIPFRVGLIPYGLNSMAMIDLNTEGMIKFICEMKYGEVIGVHIIGPHATELICKAAMAMQMEATAEDIERCIFPHPSLSESFPEAARDALGRALYMPSK